MDDEFTVESSEDEPVAFEPRKLDEKDFSKRLNQPKLSRHELDELFLTE